jgi:predicted nuclease of predicted toxin-antitoxin system
MRLLVDMDLSLGWVPFLREAVFEATHWSTVGAPDASDQALMHWAAAHDYVVVTNDLDFSTILAATGRRKPSVIQLRAGPLTPAATGGAVLRACASSRRRADLHRCGTSATAHPATRIVAKVVSG